MNLPADLETLRLDLRGPALTVTFDRPEVRNAMSWRMLDELLEVAHVLLEPVRGGGVASEDLRVVVLRGAGGNFSAGGDVRGMGDDGGRLGAGIDRVRRGNRAFGTLLSRLKRIPQVLVAAIEGAAMGGGFGLACISDVALATGDARFGTPEVTLGLVPAQIAPFLVERLGVSETRRLTLTGGQLDARAAHALGLVHRVVDDSAALDGEIDALVRQVLRCAPHAVARTKRLLSRVGVVTLGRLLDEAADLFVESLLDEGAEGIEAFLGRRLPSWTPR
ncbi:MAG TPA: enoyl-CoA hydratase-related protein [Thermoanaerobaculia bacterium]|nr:enoyl-CoA hydratase-related protein [Thermoanaerobaculia bacterium]